MKKKFNHVEMPIANHGYGTIDPPRGFVPFYYRTPIKVKYTIINKDRNYMEFSTAQDIEQYKKDIKEMNLIEYEGERRIELKSYKISYTLLFKTKAAANKAYKEKQKQYIEKEQSKVDYQLEKYNEGLADTYKRRK